MAKIFLEHSSSKKVYHFKWIYFGSSYLELKRLEEKNNKNSRIDLKKKEYLNFNFHKKIFLLWLEKQRKYFKDDILWWMNEISSRNNFYNDFFLIICQLAAIKKYLKKNSKEQNLVIFSQNYYLIKLLKENLKYNHTIYEAKVIFLFILFEKIKLFYLGIINYCKIIYYFISSFFFSKITKKKLFRPTNSIFLFHDLIISSEINKNNITQSRYFGAFPAWLNRQGYNVITLPLFYKNIRNKKKMYKRLRSLNSFIPEDWLSIKDYYNSIMKALIVRNKINERITYPYLKIHKLIEYEKVRALQSKAAIYFRYIPAINNWGRDLKKIIYFDHYQNQISEHTMRYQIKKLKIKSLTIGYYHSLHSKNYMPYQSLNDEWKSKIKPDIIITPNNLCNKTLVKQGIPKNRIKLFNDLQRKNLKIKKNFFKGNLLIILSISNETNCELLTKIHRINKFLVNDLKIKIKLRPHPYIDLNKTLDHLNWKKLPSNWKVSKHDLQKDLSESHCVITMNSAVVTDVVRFNNILVVLKSDLREGENFLDTLESKFFVLKKVEEKNLKKKLNDIFFSKRNFYKKEFLKVKKFLLQ